MLSRVIQGVAEVGFEPSSVCTWPQSQESGCLLSGPSLGGLCLTEPLRLFRGTGTPACSALHLPSLPCLMASQGNKCPFLTHRCVWVSVLEVSGMGRGHLFPQKTLLNEDEAAGDGRPALGRWFCAHPLKTAFHFWKQDPGISWPKNRDAHRKMQIRQQYHWHGTNSYIILMALK